jgi:iron(II)-dependent oxidoreductase
MDDSESIRSGQQHLDLYRRTIALLVQQREQIQPSEHIDLRQQLDETRREIMLIKRDLRAAGVTVEDHPNDGADEISAGTRAGGVDQTELVSRYQRMLLDQLRYVLLDGMSGTRQVNLPLNDLYIERALISALSSTPVVVEQSTVGSTLADVLRDPGSRVAIAGDLGSGRSTCMRHIALACVAHTTGDATLRADPISGWADPPTMPIILTAHEIEVSLGQVTAMPDDQLSSGLPRLWRAIDSWLQDRGFGALAPIIQQDLEHGSCLMLIDGFDELLNDSATHNVVAACNQFVLRYPNNRFVVACGRSDVGKSAQMHGFTHYALAPLDRGQIDSMIERWYVALAEIPSLTRTADVSEQILMLQGLLHGDELLEELATSPLMLALWILVHAEGHPLPAARGLILRRQCDLLLNGWAHSSVGGGQSLGQVLNLGVAFTAEQRVPLLQPLALALQTGSSRAPGVPSSLSYAAIESLLEAPFITLGAEPGQMVVQAIARLLAWFCRRDLLTEVAPAVYTMSRQSLCAYLAVHALAALPDFPHQAAALAIDARWYAALPPVTYELACGPARQLAFELVEQLMSSVELVGRSIWQSLLVAAECLDALGAAVSLTSSLRIEAQQRLVELLSSRKATLTQRIQAGMLLGRLGDSRLTWPLPPMARIAAGPYILGRQGGYDDEGPAQRVHVPAFAIGIYPVTNQEYAAFLNDTSDHPPRYWRDSRFNNMSCPVVGVTWHDAMAYCAWLNVQLAQAGLLPADMIVRLPLEVEWEKAASWDPRRQAKRRYPWGDDWSNTRANTAAERGDWMTTPVGCYPDGVSAYDLHDCIGNVWEWTGSVYRSYPGAAATFDEPGTYTLRGSSCISLANQAHCTFRSRLPATYWRYHLGFRIAIARPLSE